MPIAKPSRYSTDFSRVRPWYLEGDARRLRQTAMLSAHSAAELSALLSRQCANVAGRVCTLPPWLKQHYAHATGKAPTVTSKLDRLRQFRRSSNRSAVA